MQNKNQLVSIQINHIRALVFNIVLFVSQTDTEPATNTKALDSTTSVTLCDAQRTLPEVTIHCYIITI